MEDSKITCGGDVITGETPEYRKLAANAEHRADYRQANEESAPLSAQRTVFHHRTGNGTFPYQPKSFTELSG